MTNNEKLKSVAEAAARLNVHKMTVIRAIKAGKLPAAKVGRFWRIEPADDGPTWIVGGILLLIGVILLLIFGD